MRLKFGFLGSLLGLAIGVVSSSALAQTGPEVIELFAPEPSRRDTGPAGATRGIPGMLPETVGAISYFSISTQGTRAMGLARSIARPLVLRIPLPTGITVQCNVLPEERAGGILALQGTIAGSATFERCNLYEVNGRVSGEIDAQVGRYAVVPLGDSHAVVEVKTQALPNEEEPAMYPGLQPDSAPRAAATACDVPPPQGESKKAYGPLRIMVVYTTAVKEGINITTAMEQLRDQLRDAYARSDANFAVVTQIVHAEEIDYSETSYSDAEKRTYSQTLGIPFQQNTKDMQVDLFRLSNPQDVVFKRIHELRERHRADIVHLITMRNPAQNGCGLGWMISDVATGFPARGFSTSIRQCALQNFSFAHEIGHNLGLTHDRGVVPGAPASEFNFGYVLADRCARSLMAYDNTCREACAAKGGCRRLNAFSSPRLHLQDGTPFGKPLGDTLAAYNMEALCRAGARLIQRGNAQGTNGTGLDVQIALPKSTYSPGESFSFAVRANRDCNLLVYTVDANDKVEVHDPKISGAFMGAPKLAAGEQRVIPVSGKARVTDTRGTYQIGVVCSSVELEKLGITGTTLKAPAAEGHRSFTFIMDRIAEKIDREQLARATITYRVE